MANGSGGVHAKNWIKAGWSRGHRRRDDAVDARDPFLFAAADEDAATGGPDLVRGIYPMVAIIDTDGFRLLDDDDVAARAQELLGGAERGGNESREASS